MNTSIRSLFQFGLISSCICLSGCISTAKVLEMSQDNDYTQKIVDDQLIAVGFSKKPIPKYEHTLVLVGQKYSYLVENDDKHAMPNYFKDLIQTLDLQYLYLSNNDKTTQQLNTQLQQQAHTQQPSWKLHSYDRAEKPSATVFRSNVQFLYRKPLHLITASEKQQLVRLQFNCMNEKNSTYVCTKSSSFRLTLANKIENTQNLQHTLRQPIQLELLQEKSNYLKTVGSLGLLPLSISFDIVTFPLQYVYCYAAWGC